MQRSFSFSTKQLAFLLAFLLVFGGGYWTGRAGFVAQKQAVGPIPIINQEKGQPSAVDFNLFWDAWKIVDNKYVKAPDDQERVYGAIAGMIAGLGDPFSVFMKPSDTAHFNEDLDGTVSGIGAELVQKDGLITVVAPLDNSPAQKAGLQAGDVILKIDDKDAPSSLGDAVTLIRGTKGTQVKLTIVRDGKSQELTMTRDKVEVSSVVYTKKDDMALIKINQFNANTAALLDDSLAKAKKDDAKGVVIDLRNNPGGLLSSAVDVTSRFIEPGVVVVERDREKHETELKTASVSSRVTLPLVVLVNKGSASASEIFSGAIQDTGRGKIVGETSFGKGSVQSIEPLKDGSAVRITIAEWLTPKKREINKQGIKPDIEVKLNDDDVKNKRDPQLDKALELLKSGG